MKRKKEEEDDDIVFEEAPAAAASSVVEEEMELEQEKGQDEGMKRKQDDEVIVSDNEVMDVEQAEERPNEKDDEQNRETEDDFMSTEDQLQTQSSPEDPTLETRCSKNQMKLDTLDEIKVFNELRTSAEDLLRLRAFPEFGLKANNLATRLSGMVDGFALSHCALTKIILLPLIEVTKLKMKLKRQWFCQEMKVQRVYAMSCISPA